MASVKILREPGYVYDLMFAFFLKFNTQYCFDNFTREEDRDSDVAHFCKILEEFSPISDDLYLFFRAHENGLCFLTKNYHAHFKDHFPTNYDLSFVLNELHDYPTVIGRMIRCYFPHVSDEDVIACRDSSRKMVDLIKTSDYSDTVKAHLYEFFFDPIPYIQKLQFELMAQSVKLTTYYEKHHQKLLAAFDDVSFDQLCTELDGTFDVKFLAEQNQTLYLSCCLLNHVCMYFLNLKDGVTCVLGCDYRKSLEYRKNPAKLPQANSLGIVLEEESRVRMLDLLLERGELTCKDFEKLFNFSGSTAYHHLTIMLRHGALKTRNQGKTVLYSINREFFDNAGIVIARYGSKAVPR